MRLFTEIDLCIGCYTCETACKQEHNLPPGVRLMRVIQAGPEEVGGRLVMDFLPMHCRHCEDPPCLAVCPVGAIVKRPDGIVVFEGEVCIGCGTCIEACPFGAAQYDPKGKRARACDLCFQRLEQDLLPACVYHCPTGALVFGAAADYTEAKRMEQAQLFLERKHSHRSNVPHQRGEA